MTRRIVGLPLVVAALAGCVAFAPGASAADSFAASPRAQRSAGQERARAHTELAEGYYQLRNFGVALEELSIALEADSGYGPAYNLRGLVYLALGELARSEGEFKRAIQINANDSDARHNYGVLLCRMGRVDAAVAEWRGAARNPLYANIEGSYVNASVCLASAGRRGDALALLDELQRIRPLGPSALAQRERLRAEPAGAVVAPPSEAPKPPAEAAKPVAAEPPSAPREAQAAASPGPAALPAAPEPDVAQPAAGVTIAPVVLFVGSPGATRDEARAWAQSAGFVSLAPQLVQSLRGGWRLRFGPFEQAGERDAVAQAATDAGLPLTVVPVRSPAAGRGASRGGGR